jgi:hypothetical protein
MLSMATGQPADWVGNSLKVFRNGCSVAIFANLVACSVHTAHKSSARLAPNEAASVQPCHSFAVSLFHPAVSFAAQVAKRDVALMAVLALPSEEGESRRREGTN